MAKHHTRHPAIPEFLNEDLDALAMAVGRRAKAIKHQCSTLQCTKQEESGGVERFNIDVDLWETSLRISVWASGELWLRVCSGSAKNGWDFMYAAHGSWQGISPEEFQSNVETTIFNAFNAKSKPGIIENIQACWPKTRFIRDR